MIQDNQKRKVVSIITMFVFVTFVTIAAFTYAYFTANTTIGNNLTITANISDQYNPVFTAYSLDTLDLLVTTSDMLETGADSSNTTVADADTQTIYVSFIGGSPETGVTCTYDIFWENLGTTYVPSSGTDNTSIREFVLKIVDESGNTITDTTINGLQDSLVGGKATLSSGQSITSQGVLVEKKYIATATIYNLNFAQTIYNKNYSSRIGITNVSC